MKEWIKNRELMKSHFDGKTFLNEKSDQMEGVKCPPLSKPIPEDATIVSLPDPQKVILKKNDVRECIAGRKSRRKYTEEYISIEELSYLLWAIQGLVKLIRNNKIALKTVPSAGARHPFETYLIVNRVTGVKPGIYRYSFQDHTLVFMFTVKDIETKLTEAAVEQSFVGSAPVTFAWANKPYLGEWRYKGESHKAMLLDAGHVCQNLYLAAESLNLGTVAIAAYSQKKIDALLKLDGIDEYIIYMAPVGKL